MGAHIYQTSQNASKKGLNWSIFFIPGSFIGYQHLGDLLIRVLSWSLFNERGAGELSAGNTRICSRANKNNSRKRGEDTAWGRGWGQPGGSLVSWTALRVRFFPHDLVMDGILNDLACQVFSSWPRHGWDLPQWLPAPGYAGERAQGSCRLVWSKLIIWRIVLLIDKWIFFFQEIDFIIVLKLPPLSGGASHKEPACIGRQETWDLSLIPGLGRSLGGGHGNPLQVFLSGESHGQRSLAGYSPQGHKESSTTEVTTDITHTSSSNENREKIL